MRRGESTLQNQVATGPLRLTRAQAHKKTRPETGFEHFPGWITVPQLLAGPHPPYQRGYLQLQSLHLGVPQSFLPPCLCRRK